MSSRALRYKVMPQRHQAGSMNKEATILHAQVLQNKILAAETNIQSVSHIPTSQRCILAKHHSTSAVL